MLNINKLIQRGVAAYKEGKLKEAELNFKKAIELKPDYYQAYYNLANIQIELSRLDEALSNLKKTIELNPGFATAYNNLGVIFDKIGKLNEAEISYKKTIELNPNLADPHNNLGAIYNKLGRFDEAEISYKKALQINPNYAEALNNLGNNYLYTEKYDEAIKQYSRSLELEPKLVVAKKNIISLLRYFTPNKKNNNSIVIANNNLKKIKNNFTLKDGIKKNDLANLFKDSNKVIRDNNKELTIEETQIYRKNSTNLNCKRHKEIFNKFNIIPKFCFGCFKIQIEPKNVLELFKLFFIFDKLELPKNNTRKCTIEVRPNVLGTYKGLIYCSGIDEANEILKVITPILDKFITGKVKIKRGCTEYSDAFPNYKVTDKNEINFMEYNERWIEKEIFFDKSKTLLKEITTTSSSGLSISDVLIMNNWLNYAKKINDLTYKDISQEMLYSDYISRVLSEQLVMRKKEFFSQFNLLKKLFLFFNINI